MTCLFCGHPEKSRYKQPANVDIICSSCTPVLAGLEVDDLKLAYAKAINEKAYGIRKALESFLPKQYHVKG